MDKFVNKHRTLAIVLLMTLMSAFTLAQLPEWAKTGKSGKYPEDLFWSTVTRGQGPTALEIAKEMGKAEIAQQLKVTVSSKSSLVETEKIVGKDMSSTSDFRREAESMVENMQLIGLAFPETYVNPVDNTAYVLAVMNKEAFLKGLASELEMLVGQMRTKLENARKQLADGDLGEAINAYTNLLGEVSVIYPKIIFYNSLALIPYQLPQDLVYETIEFEFLKLFGNVSLEIVSGNKQTTDIGKMLAQPLVVKATIKTDAGAKPLKGITIKFASGKQDSEPALTDGDGVATIRLLASPDAVKGGKHGTITSYVYMPRISNQLRSKLEANTTINFEFEVIATAGITIGLEVVGDGSNTSKLEVTKKVAKQLEKNGANVNQSDFKFLMRIVFTITDGQTVSGMGGNMYTKNASMELILIEKASADVIGSASSSAKGIDKDANRAAEKAVLAVPVPTKELSELLGKAKDRAVK